ncbi:MAG TPA: PAS domain-containing protein [Candidatus Limnocylindria bacterium]|nr:PAS domain-containing protein [Candidatus Limnocylindria bacterium]
MPAVRVVTIPSADRAFRVHVETIAEELGGPDPSALEGRLRAPYPSATVSTSSALGSLIAGDARIYVYRDRSAAREPDPSDWWLSEELPRAVVNPEGRYVDANPAIAELFGVPLAKVIGSEAGRFTLHEQDPEIARRLFEALATYGELASTATVRQPDGTEIAIEFHMHRTAAGTGYETVMRPRGGGLRMGHPDSAR